MDAETLQKVLELAAANPGNIGLNSVTADYAASLDEALGARLTQCLKSGIENADSSAMGCYAMQPTDYDDLKPFFAKVLAAYHGVEEDAVHRTDWDLGGDQQAGSPLDLDALGVPGVSMRVRVGRNLEGFPLPGAMTVEDRVALEAKMKEVFDVMIANPDFGGQYLSITPDHPNEMEVELYEALLEAHIMFKDMSADPYLAAAGIAADFPHGRGCYISDDKGFAIWVGEEDHLRIMCMKVGTVLNEIFDRLKSALELVEAIEGIDFVKSADYGYVTSCPTNLGTGMRASVHLPLPALTADGEHDERVQSIADSHGLSVRGLGGEHTALGTDGTIDVSPRARFCITEAEILVALYRGVESLWEAEAEAAAELAEAAEETDEGFLSHREERAMWAPEPAVVALVHQLNALRANPKKWAREVLKPMRQYFHSRLFDAGDGPGERRMTVEGIAALEDAIRFCHNIKKCPPLRLSYVLSKVARRQVKPHASAKTNVAGGHALGQLHNRAIAKSKTSVTTSTLASKTIVQELQHRADKAGGRVGEEAGMCFSAFAAPDDGSTIALGCAAASHVAHMLMNDDDPYRNCRAIFANKDYGAVGIASDSSRLATVEEVEGVEPLVGPTCVLVFSDSCRVYRVPPPPAPAPAPVPTVQDLINARRDKFRLQRTREIEAVAAAKQRVATLRHDEWRVERDAVLEGRAGLQKSTTICFGNAVRHPPVVLGED